MVNYDPIDHYCFLIQEAINEGGSKIKEPHAGITSDMSGRWTIKAFDTDTHNKKETPKMKEAIYANNAGIMEVFKFFEKATDAEKQQFDNLVNAGNQNAALKLVEKVLGVKFQGDLTLQ
jgi:hypothetical protein